MLITEAMNCFLTDLMFAEVSVEALPAQTRVGCYAIDARRVVLAGVVCAVVDVHLAVSTGEAVVTPTVVAAQFVDTRVVAARRRGTVVSD